MSLFTGTKEAEAIDGMYTVHTLESAPEMAADGLRTLQSTVGLIPNLAATMAESPALLNGFLALRELYATTGFSAARCRCSRCRRRMRTIARGVSPFTPRWR